MESSKVDTATIHLHTRQLCYYIVQRSFISYQKTFIMYHCVNVSGQIDTFNLLSWSV